MNFRKLTILKAESSDFASLESITSALDAAGAVYNSVDCCNWPAEFPYTPKVKFRIAYTEEAILLEFKIKEEGSRAAYDYDFGSKPYTDSCVEFFLIPDQKKGDYFNVETNCIGHGTFACGPDRHNRHNFDDNVISKIKRYSTLGSEAFGIKEGECEFTVAQTIPFSIYGLDGRNVSRQTFKANFYKCGDLMEKVHFLSWSPVGTPGPDFHCPEWFGEIVFG